MNPKRILSLSLAALAASCVESADKPVLRGQATKKIQRQRQLKKEACGGFGATCCGKRIQGTRYSYCASGGHSCNVTNNLCNNFSSEEGGMEAPLPVCVDQTAGETACGVIGSGNYTDCSPDENGYDSEVCGDAGMKCLTCERTYTCSEDFCTGADETCHPTDSSCCVVADDATNDAGLTYCY